MLYFDPHFEDRHIHMSETVEKMLVSFRCNGASVNLILVA